MKMSQTVGKVLVYSSISQCMHAKSLPMNTELRRVGTWDRERAEGSEKFKGVVRLQLMF